MKHRATLIAICALLAVAPALSMGGTDLPANLPAAPTDADYRPVDPQEAALGRLLFYDPILSGNREVACATCHHPAFGTSDGLSLSLGDGGIGLGPMRRPDPANPPEQRVPRNAQSLFNLGAREYVSMFHDGRVETDPAAPNGLRTPLDEEMPAGMVSALAAQAMFPVLSADEMAGNYSENDISRAVRMGLLTGPGGAWDLIARRVAAVPDYAAAFQALSPRIAGPQDIGFADIANAIAAFIELEWRSDGAPFDAFLRGQAELPPLAMQGLQLFYGSAGCAACHSGPFQTDQAFHAMAAPQIGPGKSAPFERVHRDEGRFRVTGRPQDLYAFRTPSLRNLALTAPYGHAGSHADLRRFVADHAEGAAALARYDRSQPVLWPLAEDDWWALDTPAEIQAIAAARTAPSQRLSAADLDALMAFLDTLNDPQARTGRLGVPDRVPSGLPVPHQ